MLGQTFKKLPESPLSVLLSVTLLLQVTVTIVFCQGEDATPGQCTCVPYYLCANHTIVTNGKGLIDLRFRGSMKCPNFEDVCCDESTKSKVTSEEIVTNLDPEQPILGSFFTPYPPPPSSDTCKCVPYYLCANHTIVTNGKGLKDQRFGRDLKCPGILDVCCSELMILKEPEEKDKIIDKIIWEIYPTPKPPTLSSDMCKCVPLFLCKNGTVVTSGNGLIDPRFKGSIKCLNVEVMCCYESTKSKVTYEEIVTKLDPEQPILGSFFTPYPPPPSSDTCKCVPYYLCSNHTIVSNGKGLIDQRFRGDIKCPGILDVCCNESTKSKETTEKDMTTINLHKAIWSVFPRPPHLPPPSDQCICVPHHLCRDEMNNVARKPETIDIRMYKHRCPNSMVVCCFKPMRTKNLIIPYEHRTICGHWNSDGVRVRKTGHTNNEAQFGEFPWMMAILKLEANQSTIYMCGGSLIHPKVVLTGVHCVIGKNPNDLVIRAGEWDLQTKNELLPSQDRKVLKIINHEHFDPDVLVNDVALIIVTKPFLLRENVGTICLPSPNFVFDKQRCYASGWGQKIFGKLGVNQVILKKIDLPIVPRSSCMELLRKTRLGAYYILPEGFMCAGGGIGKDTCQGDGGSPLMCPLKNKPKQFQQAGIVSWGIGCGNETPGVYVDVASFRNWIDEQMAKEKLDQKYYDPEYVPTN